MTIEPERGVALAVELRNAGASRVLTPDQDGYVDALTGFNLAVTHSPEVVVAAETADDLIAAVQVADRLGVPVRVLGRGHGTPWAITDGIAVTTTGLAGVEVDPEERVARVQAGTSWSDVLAAAGPHGLAALCGSAPDVGVVGFTLGGGIGPIARTYGFAADHVRALSVVTPADGLILADSDSHPDLFWALRGGKAGLGIVAEIEIDLLPLTEIYGGGLYFAASDIAAAARAFLAWSRDLPDEATASFAILRLPPLEFLPEPLRGATVGHLRYGYVGEADAGEALLTPMREVATPLLDGVGPLPYAQIGVIHSDPVDPIPVLDGGILLDELEEEALDRTLAVAGPRAEIPFIAIELRRLGGALSQPAAVPNAANGRDAEFALHLVGAPVPELFDHVIPAIAEQILATVDPDGRAATQINFVGPLSGPNAWERAYPENVRARLDDVRRRYDPQGLFRLPQP